MFEKGWVDNHFRIVYFGLKTIRKQAALLF